MTRRAVPEWIGKTPDTRPPPRVLARIFEREGGVCHISGRKIQPGERWQADHKIALVNGGENKESNLFPALIEPHKAKTRADVAEKKTIARKRAKHIGAIAPKAAIKSRVRPSSRKAARIEKAPVPNNSQLARMARQ
jgi:5-methylcytosine-specific restriction endonuclease McrA